MPGKRVIRISVFHGYSSKVVCISTALAKKGRTPRDSKYIYPSKSQVQRLASTLNDLAHSGRGELYAHPACGFVWYR